MLQLKPSSEIAKELASAIKIEGGLAIIYDAMMDVLDSCKSGSPEETFFEEMAVSVLEMVEGSRG
jgi:hypothetical protein